MRSTTVASNGSVHCPKRLVRDRSVVFGRAIARVRRSIVRGSNDDPEEGAMAKLAGRRMAAEIDGDFVVFLIGARPNSKLRLLQAFLDLGGRRGMKHMLDHLVAHPEKGLLGYEMGLPTIVQYWRSFDHLEAFAKNTDDPHLDVWRNYWRRVGKSGRTGDLARDLPREGRRVRGDLRQHAGARARQGRQARADLRGDGRPRAPPGRRRPRRRPDALLARRPLRVAGEPAQHARARSR